MVELTQVGYSKLPIYTPSTSLHFELGDRRSLKVGRGVATHGRPYTRAVTAGQSHPHVILAYILFAHCNKLVLRVHLVVTLNAAILAYLLIICYAVHKFRLKYVLNGVII